MAKWIAKKLRRRSKNKDERTNKNAIDQEITTAIQKNSTVEERPEPIKIRQTSEPSPRPSVSEKLANKMLGFEERSSAESKTAKKKLGWRRRLKKRLEKRLAKKLKKRSQSLELSSPSESAEGMQALTIQNVQELSNELGAAPVLNGSVSDDQGSSDGAMSEPEPELVRLRSLSDFDHTNRHSQSANAKPGTKPLRHLADGANSLTKSSPADKFLKQLRTNPRQEKQILQPLSTHTSQAFWDNLLHHPPLAQNHYFGPDNAFFDFGMCVSDDSCSPNFNHKEHHEEKEGADMRVSRSPLKSAELKPMPRSFIQDEQPYSRASAVLLRKPPKEIEEQSGDDTEDNLSHSDPMHLWDHLKEGLGEMFTDRWAIHVEMSHQPSVVVQVPCKLGPTIHAEEVACSAYKQYLSQHINGKEAIATSSLSLFDKEEGRAYQDGEILSRSTHGKRVLSLRVKFENGACPVPDTKEMEESRINRLDDQQDRFNKLLRSGAHACFPKSSCNYKHDDCFDFNSWKEPDLPFQIRSKTYLSNRLKEDSAPTAYMMLGCDLLLSKTPQLCMAQDPRGFLARARAKSGNKTPWLFIVNYVLPWGNFVGYWSPRNGSNTPYIGDPVFDRTMRRFMEGDKKYRNSRLKLVPRGVQGPWVIRKTANGKPCIIGTKIQQDFYEGEGYLEVSIDNSSSAGAAYVLKMVQKYAKSVVMDFGYVLQGELEDELPERILGAMRWFRLDEESAWSYNEWINRPSEPES